MAVSVAWRTAKWLVKHADDIAPPAYFVLKELLDNDVDVDEPGWHRFVVKYNRATPSGITEDTAQWKIDLLKVADGGSDNSWTGAEFTAIGSAIDSFCTAVRSHLATTHTYAELRAYRMRFNPGDPGPGQGPLNPPKPFQMTGPPVYVIGKSQAGTGASVYPYQVACSVTLRTGWPRHWGRIYLPGFGSTMDTKGRIPSATTVTIANAAFDLADDLAAAGFLWCVPVTQLNKQRFHGLLGVRDVVVDDIPDVIRRRRPKYPAFRTVGVE